MKFEKFVKSLASTGTIYERENGERWLASLTVYMKIPPLTKSITCTQIKQMPKVIEEIIAEYGKVENATLTAAYMPVANGGIRECEREYTVESGVAKCVLYNDDWSLLEKDDLTELLYSYDLDTDTQKVKAMLVKVLPFAPTDPDELVGIIFPIFEMKGDN